MKELDRKILQAVQTLDDKADQSHVAANVFGPEHSVRQSVKMVSSLQHLKEIGYISILKEPGKHGPRYSYRIEVRGEQALAGTLVESPAPPRYVSYSGPIAGILLLFGLYDLAVLKIGWIPYAVTVGLVVNTLWARHLTRKYSSEPDSQKRSPKPERRKRDDLASKIMVNEDLKRAIRSVIRQVGVVGLVVIFLTLLSATYRVPGTPLDIHTGITPLLKAELPHSKADLETVYGAPGSEMRKIIASRWLPMMGEDFLPGWMIFLFALYKLIPYVTPRLLHHQYLFLFLLILPMLVDYFAIHQMVTVANSTVFTDEMAASLWLLSRLKWLSLFGATMFCAAPLADSHPVLKFGEYLFIVASFVGMMALSGDREWLLAPSVFALFIGLCGITVMFLVRPEFLYPVPIPATPSSGED